MSREMGPRKIRIGAIQGEKRQLPTEGLAALLAAEAVQPAVCLKNTVKCSAPQIFRNFLL